jgi:hypothetical protein
MRRERTTDDRAAKRREAQARYRRTPKGQAAERAAQARRRERKNETAEIIF